VLLVTRQIKSDNTNIRAILCERMNFYKNLCENINVTSTKRRTHAKHIKKTKIFFD